MGTWFPRSIFLPWECDPAAGRFFRADTEKPRHGAGSWWSATRFWRSYLNSDPRAVGRVVRLSGQLRPCRIRAPRFSGGCGDGKSPRPGFCSR